ncbi:MAG: 16S rRNA (guanine(966)-N(2))-methyltransferase RsmD [Ectothiorhodospiraceae bacterium]|nr:16S rRNA (guanine(966)-N(2))-methyltransferase RsmD [Ectothiorhodospiraceae bacterium]
MARHGGNRLRIIAGKWRGRRLRFAATPGLRPTGDRNRETLFNWLQTRIPDSRCLDLFAGSGALGFEAASRGAARVLLVERADAAARQLQENIRELRAGEQLALHRGDALRFLRGEADETFDLVFLDPPFDSELLGRACELLEQRGWLADDALIYLETPAARGLPPLPPNWQPHRERRSGQVLYALLRRTPAQPSLKPPAVNAFM